MRSVLFILPILGTLTLVVTYIFIIAKRSQKQAMLKEDAPINNEVKLVDQSEKVWWPMCLMGVFLMYLGLIAMIAQVTQLINLQDALFVGILFFLVLVIIGRKFVA